MQACGSVFALQRTSRVRVCCELVYDRRLWEVASRTDTATLPHDNADSDVQETGFGWLSLISSTLQVDRGVQV
jgi:hypothetical protein